MEGRLAPFSGVEVESMTDLSVRPVAHAKDELNRYIALIEHPYGQLNRVIAQMAGLLILGQASNGFTTYVQLAHTPEQKLIEILDLLANLKVPAMAAAHFKHLSFATSTLLQIARALQRNINHGAAVKAHTPAWLDGINKANALLRCTSIPQSRLMPVDLHNTCFCCPQH